MFLYQGGMQDGGCAEGVGMDIIPSIARHFCQFHPS
jgi:hypothetical protein